MKRTILALALTLSCGVTVYSQRAETRTSGESSNEIAASAKAGKSIDLNSGTRIAGELQNTVDVRKARVGDEVILKTTQAIKSEGRTVVGRGARLIGHVTEVEQKSKANGQSRVGLIFDRLEKGSLEFPIAATITSIASGRTTAQAGGNDLFGSQASGASSSSASSTTQSSSGGLLGGVTSTVGGVVNTSTTALGSTVNATTNAAGGTTSGLGQSLGRIQINQSSSTSAEGGAVLSLQGQNLRLEKGTTFNLMLTQSTNASTNKEQ